MEIANTRLVLTKVGSDVPKNDITPAEAMLLHILHGPSNGGKTFGEFEGNGFPKIVVSGTAMVKDNIPDKVEPDVPAKPAVGTPGQPNYVEAKPAVKGRVLSYKEGLRPRTDTEELNRLRRIYGQAKLKDGKAIVDQVWPDKFNPKLPQTFAELKWDEIGLTGIEAAPLNYATGGLVASTLPN
jgi:hypothetical protein